MTWAIFQRKIGKFNLLSKSICIFAHDKALKKKRKVEAENADELDLFNVCGINDILKRINLITSDKPLSKEVIESIYQTLLDKEAYVNDEMHLESIKKITKDRREHQKQLRTAIEKKICPDCGGILSIVPGGLKCTKCNKLIKIV